MQSAADNPDYTYTNHSTCMLDTHSRKHLQPVLDLIAQLCLRLGITADTLTVSGLVLGVIAALFVYVGLPTEGIIALWLSGLLDAADGTLARMTQPSPLGAIMDITFDRVVETGLIIALASRYPEARLALLMLTAVILVAMSLFLSIAATVVNTTPKAFHYASGLTERTEGFIFFSFMALDAERLEMWTLLFAATILFTIAQRLRDVRCELRRAMSAD